MSIIDQNLAANVLNYFGEGGWEAGGFTSKLMSAIAHADDHNLFLLSLGFPELVAAMRIAMRTSDGMERLRVVFDGGAPMRVIAGVVDPS